MWKVYRFVDGAGREFYLVGRPYLLLFTKYWKPLAHNKPRRYYEGHWGKKGAQEQADLLNRLDKESKCRRT
ncbi:hypothetical protein KIT05_29 [Vibrio phage KIT05]|nr:hypothetical protein KIT05_29 [Vibrio phage KIT05]